ncbi:MAG TPA: 4Fe-4S dicluster domain-containing protein [Adlercreutzia equolifaciens]|uniref:4Fe-4S dicluster domain-containing protein n=1 Tax=Adlercreutzia equolifaciens TaxID=446660 RepID=UPI0024318B64|nr:4Fe-4S dicluster domain-containing protein [Adlercreutzia equolifaciens]HJI11400.1 4Fe-4S dicluster domain-containing protein [Adlercreutzia equolifaciens]
MTKYGMAVDTNRCTGCNMCTMVCRVGHNLPNGVMYSQAVTEGGDGFRVAGGTYPDKVVMDFYTLGCQHCDEPACVDICPTGATKKREEDGIVIVDSAECIGCESCIAACPYDGVRVKLDSTPTYPLEFTLGDWRTPEHVGNTVEKCTFCVELIDAGERPMCIDICPSVARYFGDLDDPNSEISQVLAEREYTQLLTDQGTGPNVYFLK